ncbi:MAG: nucleotidyltransferase family protein [Candidatus Helarchaeota archaeon]
MLNNIEMKKKFQKILSDVVEYLKSIGTTEIILFGSLVDGTYNEYSDIDLAISGISPRLYFKTLSILSSIVGKKIDLVLLGHVSKDFETKIRLEGVTIYAI